MLVNAIPSVITVAIFSMVWQYNDTFYAKLKLVSERLVWKNGYELCAYFLIGKKKKEWGHIMKKSR
jgi:ABC-type glycerol-3-phosphate transport system permease component